MLETIWKKIVRRNPYSLWDIPAFFLWLLSFVYRLGYLIDRSRRAQPEKVAVPVISIGNIVVGGSGKTPLVSFLVRDLLEAGIRVGIVSSGYGRSGKQSILDSGYKVAQMDVAATGDEMMLLAVQHPDAVFSIDSSKLVAARTLADSGLVDVIVVDDGFQHYGLARDVDLVTYDAGVKRRQLKSFPYGILREPMSALSRADIIVITRAKFAQDINAIKRRLRKINPRAQIYTAGFAAQQIIGRDRTIPVKYLEDKSVFLFAGVGNFRALERQVSALCGDLDCAFELSDHQEYDAELLASIKKRADRLDSDLLLTTMKDWVKLGAFDFGREFYYLDLAVDLDPGEEKLLAYLTESLNLSRQEH
ncbi:MAG: tetraacyldisaccharide 4'-kinase [candidate division Zixibacteria bacterium]|nr:tetraacyldisaccharide 4'-kinase [candidate division Zixibacteria bacterium]